jgi:hypothetical protein
VAVIRIRVLAFRVRSTAGSVATLQLFKWRQFEPEMILLAVGWYLRFSLSYRDVEELLAERTVGRPRHRLEVGPTLRAGNSAPIATAAPTDQR